MKLFDRLYDWFLGHAGFFLVVWYLVLIGCLVYLVKFQ